MGEKTIGIFGVMGPEATVDLYYRIVKATPVKRGHVHCRTMARAQKNYIKKKLILLLAIVIICLSKLPFIPKAESMQSSSILCKVSKPIIKFNETQTVYVEFTPKIENAMGGIVIRDPKFAEKRQLTYTNVSGAYSYTFKADWLGTWKVYAWWLGDDQHVGSTSDIISFQVKGPPESHHKYNSYSNLTWSKPVYHPGDEGNLTITYYNFQNGLTEPRLNTHMNITGLSIWFSWNITKWTGSGLGVNYSEEEVYHEFNFRDQVIKLYPGDSYTFPTISFSVPLDVRTREGAREPYGHWCLIGMESSSVYYYDARSKAYSGARAHYGRIHLCDFNMEYKNIQEPQSTPEPEPEPEPARYPFYINIEPKEATISTQKKVTYNCKIEASPNFHESITFKIRVKSSFWNIEQHVGTIDPPYPQEFSYDLKIPEELPEEAIVTVTIIGTSAARGTERGYTVQESVNLTIHGPSIPGFPIESVIIGLILGILIIWKMQRRN